MSAYIADPYFYLKPAAVEAIKHTCRVFVDAALQIPHNMIVVWIKEGVSVHGFLAHVVHVLNERLIKLGKTIDVSSVSLIYTVHSKLFLVAETEEPFKVYSSHEKDPTFGFFIKSSLSAALVYETDGSVAIPTNQHTGVVIVDRSLGVSVQSLSVSLDFGETVSQMSARVCQIVNNQISTSARSLFLSAMYFSIHSRTLVS
eukprot:TRINITY_DN4248_c0_g1_i1.p1 TRINITY_DN4248_c0_g1~~TRINITY_DN4248_c0_g1_i1.p1  ORF type:complete len:201 (+),score=63.11 TRINITY_DN4248_c0_g1_i1:282-884(+)